MKKIIVLACLFCFSGFSGDYYKQYKPTKNKYIQPSYATGRYHKPTTTAKNTLQRTNRIPVPIPKVENRPKYYKPPTSNPWVFRTFEKSKSYYNSGSISVKGHWRKSKNGGRHWVRRHTRRR